MSIGKPGAEARKLVAFNGRLKPPSSTVAHAFSRRPASLTPDQITQLPNYPITKSGITQLPNLQSPSTLGPHLLQPPPAVRLLLPVLTVPVQPHRLGHIPDAAA